MELISCNDFNSYRRYALSIPNLSKEEEANLCILKDEGDLIAAQKLILSQLKTVIYIAKKFINYGVSIEELVQEGNIGLMKAVKNFKTSFNVRLFSYAIHWIKAEIQGYIISNWKIVKIGNSKALRKLFFNFRKNQNELINYGMTNESINNEIAKKLGVSLDEVTKIESYFIPDEDIDILEYKPSELNEPIKQLEIKEEEKLLSRIRGLIENLNERERYIMESKYLNEKKLTNKDISEYLKISSERVRQIESKILAKLKSQL